MGTQYARQAMSPRISVAVINNFPGPSIGGGEVQLLALLRGLIGAGVRPTVLCAAQSAMEREARGLLAADVVPVGFGGRSLPALVSALAPRLRNHQIIQGTGFLTNIVARRVGATAGVRVVNTVHVVPGAARIDGESRVLSGIRWLLDHSSRTYVDRFVAVSEAVRAGLIADRVDPTRIVVIPNGVDVARLRKAATEPLDTPLAYGRPRVGFVGRLERLKGCEDFIRISALLAERYPEARFIVAGTGSRKNALRELVCQLGLDSRVQFLGFVRSAPSLLAALDVVIIPSLSEASGMTAMEALAVGVPVVASDVGGLPEVVVDGETGLLARPADVPALSRAISRLLDDPQLARRLATAGAHRIEQLFREERMVLGYLELYEELLS